MTTLSILSCCYFLISSSLTLALKVTDVTETKCATDCGVKTIQRIVGGNEATVNEYPWMASLMEGTDEETDPFCGGSIIAENWILTAAHCLPGIALEELYIRVGEHDMDSDAESKHQTIGVTRMISHPKYNKSGHDHDIALLELKSAIQYATHIAPVCLPFSQKVSWYNGEKLNVIGYGHTQEDGEGTRVLMELQLDIMSVTFCNYTYEMLTENMFCAYTKGQDSCQGDSGGPATVDSAGTHVQMGVVSFGGGCAREGVPGVYARVENYLDWIQSETKASFCKKKFKVEMSTLQGTFAPTPDSPELRQSTSKPIVTV